MNEGALYLTPDQIKELIESLRQFQHEHDAFSTTNDGASKERLLQGFHEFLGDFLGEQETGSEEAALELAELYHSEGIPFVLLMGSFNHLKTRLIELVASNTPDPLAQYRRIDQIFEHAKSTTAHHYLISEASQPCPLPQATIRDKPLIQSGLTWMNRLREAITGDLSDYPLEDAKENDFTRALRYPESLLICLDLKVCDQIMQEHLMLIQQGGLLYAMLQSGRYEQAYLTFQELQRKFTQLLNLVATLYFEAETNRVNRFFGFMQAALYLPGQKVFCIINLRRLGKTNALYGNDAGNRALEQVEHALQEICKKNQEWLVYTRGISGDFYLFGLDHPPSELNGVIRELEHRLAEEDHGLQETPALRHYGIELSNVNELTMENMHVLVEYLDSMSRKQTSTIETGEQATERMFSWIQKRYRRSINLRQKLSEDATDIFVQPLVKLDSRDEIHAFEVLGRFREEDGYISAGMFIDDIIDMGLIVEFDSLILRCIVQQRKQLSTLTDRLFINISASSLQDEHFLDELSEALDGPLSGFEIVLELTEQVLLDAQKLVVDLHGRHGLTFAIDDFGTGYSSLHTVIELALEGGVRYLKLDGSLTRTLSSHPASERILRITRQMASELHLETVAEMIETQEEHDRMEQLGIDLGQGYLIGIPDPVPVWVGKMNYLKARQSQNQQSGFVY